MSEQHVCEHCFQEHTPCCPECPCWGVTTVEAVHEMLGEEIFGDGQQRDLAERIIRCVVKRLGPGTSGDRSLLRAPTDAAIEAAQTRWQEDHDWRTTLAAAYAVDGLRGTEDRALRDVLGYLDAAAQEIDAASHTEDNAFHLATAQVAIVAARALLREKDAPEAVGAEDVRFMALNICQRSGHASAPCSDCLAWTESLLWRSRQSNTPVPILRESVEGEQRT